MTGFRIGNIYVVVYLHPGPVPRKRITYMHASLMRKQSDLSLYLGCAPFTEYRSKRTAVKRQEKSTRDRLPAKRTIARLHVCDGCTSSQFRSLLADRRATEEANTQMAASEK